MDRDAALLAATFAEREDVMEDVEVDSRLENALFIFERFYRIYLGDGGRQ